MKAIHLLLLEDNDADRMIVSRMLEDINDKNYVIYPYNNVDDAIRHLVYQHSPIDICLVDHNIAGSTAEEFITVLQEKDVDLPAIIVMSGHIDELIAKRLRLIGVQEYHDKNGLYQGKLNGCICAALQRHRHPH